MPQSKAIAAKAAPAAHMPEPIRFAAPPVVLVAAAADATLAEEGVPDETLPVAAFAALVTDIAPDAMLEATLAAELNAALAAELNAVPNAPPMTLLPVEDPVLAAVGLDDEAQNADEVDYVETYVLQSCPAKAIVAGQTSAIQGKPNASRELTRLLIRGALVGYATRETCNPSCTVANTPDVNEVTSSG
ncbi:hypothetical protein MMC24_000864 [Lignoscripta atroalba]|nr:hypothetical protein [Lignoscripta atroalba]